MQGSDASGNMSVNETTKSRAREARLERVHSQIDKHGNVDDVPDKVCMLWEATFNAMEDSVMVIDSHSRITHANLATSRLLNKPLEEIIGKTCWQTVHGTNGPPKECPLKRALSSGKREEAELYIPERNMWIEVSTDPIVDDKGRTNSAVHLIRDISERRRAEETLRRSEEQHRAIFNGARDGIVYADKRARVIDVNPAFTRITGIPREQVVGKSGFSLARRFAKAKDIPHLIKAVRQALKGEPIELYELEINHRIVEISTPSLKRGQSGITGVIRDITERKRVEETVRISEARLSQAMKIAKLAYWEYDATNDVFTFNDQFYSVYRMSAEKVGGYRISSRQYAELFLHPDDMLQLREEIQRATDTSDPDFCGGGEHRFIYGDGQIGYVSVRYLVVKDSQGRTIKTYGVNQDITERKKAEEALRTSEEKHRLLLQHAGCGIGYWDLSGRIQYLNTRATDDLGGTWENYSGKTAHEIFGKVRGDRIIERIHRISEKTQSEKYEEQVELPIGKKWFVSTYSPIRGNEGQCVGVQIVSHDITERKRAEESLRASESKLSEGAKLAKLAYWEHDVLDELYTFSDHFYEILRTTADKVGGHKMPCSQYFETFVHPDDREKVKAKCRDIFEDPDSQASNYLEHRIIYADGEIGHIAVRFSIVRDDQGRVIKTYGVNQDITERKQAEQERLAHLRFLESMDKVNRAIQGTNDLEQMMSDVLDEVLSLFDCDRASLVYPCDPEAAMWRAPIERTKPKWPGTFALGLEVPMNPEVARVFRISRAADGPVKFGPDYKEQLPTEIAAQFNIQSQMTMALYPKIGKPWNFVMHQCSYPRVWTSQEERLLQEIGRRLEDALTSLIILRDLKESENKYRELANSITDVFFALDTELKYTYWNKASENLTGIKAEEVIGKTIFEIFPDTQETKKAAAVYQDVLKKKQPKSFENEYRLEDKHYFLEINAYPSEDGISVFVKDITERKRAEEAYRSLVDHSLQGLVIFQEGRVVFANETMAKITDYTMGEMLAMSPDEVQAFVHPEDREMVWERHAQRLNGSPLSERYELRGIRKDGSVRWLEIDACLVEYQGKPAIQAAYVDITERKRSEEAIRTSEVRYRELFHHMSSGVAVFVSRGEGEDFVFLDFNEAGEQIDDVKKEDVIGKSVVDVFPGVKEFGLFDVFQNVWKTGVPQHHPVSFYKDNRLVGWRENYVHKLPSGEIVAVYKDLTDRVKAENALRESEGQLRRAQELAHVGSWHLDLRTSRLTWSDETYRIFGELVGRALTEADFLAFVHLDDVAYVRQSWTTALHSGRYDIEHRIVAGGIVKWVREKAEIEFDSDGEPVSAIGMVQDITERVIAEQRRLAQVHFLESMARVNRAIQGTDSLEEMMSSVLGEVLDILECDRAFFVYPCDPDSPTWSVPMERTRPEYPGITPDAEMQTDDEIAEVRRILLASDGPVRFGPGAEHPLPSSVAEQFGYESMIGMALYPKTGLPWVFGLHQCSYPRVWTPEDERLFQEIGQRLADGLTSLLVLRSLRESEGRLAEAQRVAHVGHWERDIETDRITWSDEAYRIFGLRPQERILSLAQLEERLHPEDRWIMTQAVTEALNGGARYDVEYRVIQPTGEVRVVRCQGDVTWDESDGRPLRMFGAIQDITESKRVEEALRESEQKYRELFENAREAIVILDMDGKITDANKFIEGYGFRKEDLIGRSHFDFVMEKYKEKAVEDFEKLRHGIPQEGEYEVITPKGIITVYYRDNPIVRAGDVIGAQSVLMDITERRRTEDELRKYQVKLKAMASEILLTEERERGRLAVGLHDNVCQNLVLAKLTLESALRSISDGSLAASLMTVADVVGETINQAESLTFELSNPVLRAFGFIAALDRYLNEEIHAKHGIVVELEVKEQVGPLEHDLRVCLFRVTRELLTNVLKHAKASKVTVVVGKRRDNIYVTVRDDGVGFESGGHNLKGSGVVRFGLFSVREQLEQLGGCLTIESEPGRGTTATVVV